MPDRPHLPALTGLRFVAAVAVAFAHLPHLHNAESVPPVLRRLFAEGFLGVPFFFVLSGFVLAYTYHDRFPTLGRAGLVKYYTARIARIGPVHWLTMAVAAVVTIPGAATGGGPGALVLTAVLLQNWVIDPRFVAGYNPVAWSLAAEAWFYLWLPVVLWGIARSRWPSTRLVGCGAAVWVVGLLFARFAAAHPTTERVWFAVLCPAGRFGEFLVGVVLGVGFARTATRPSINRIATGWSILELTAAGLVLTLVLLADRVPMVLRQTVYYTPAMAALVYVCAHGRGVVSRLLSGRVAVYLGEISFSFFMVHGIVFSLLTPLARVDAGGVGGRAIVHLVAAGVVAAAVHRYYEMPLRKGITRPKTGQRFRLGGFFSAAIRRSSIRR